MLYIFCFTVAAEICFAGFYLFLPSMQKGCRDLIGKSVCAVGFVLVCITAILANGIITQFSLLIFIGAFLGAVGDILLGISMKGVWFICGLLSFMSGHIFYIIAFCTKGQGAVFSISEIAAIAALLVIGILAGYRIKFNAGKLLPAILFYAAAIVTMLVKAVSLSIAMLASDFSNLPAALCLTLGAAFFVISDTLLSLRLFAHISPKKAPWLCLTAYFTAQILIASSTYFIR